MAVSVAHARRVEKPEKVRISAVIFVEHYEVILEVKRALEEELGTPVSDSFVLRHILSEFARQNRIF